MQVFNRIAKEDREKFLLDVGELHPRYTLSAKSRGRANPIEEDSLRTCFEIDQHRIIHSKAFHRLAGKSQVFLLPQTEHLMTRESHTMKVMQIASSLCSYLRLNQTLAEAAALGHDLGHVPFGHVGEETLTKVVQRLTGDKNYLFHHAAYSLEVVDRIEKDGRGLNLTAEVRDGILKHSLGKTKLAAEQVLPFTYEGQIVRFSDKIAYVCADLSDALEVDYVSREQLPQEAMKVLGTRESKWIDCCINSLVECNKHTFDSNYDGNLVWEGEVFEAFEEVRRFMYDNVYQAGKLDEEFAKAARLMEFVFEDVLLKEYSGLEQDEAMMKTLDRVAGMTDRSLLEYFNNQFIPRPVK
ncbi:MAG: HD domain-containing protein [Nanoarchaeota archaeon]|nr:HD domain-containing protein [Nanoarchaeota archaeon]MBU1621959.1 HD domain-containing protein [Nanoarchaeota archaeon]